MEYYIELINKNGDKIEPFKVYEENEELTMQKIQSILENKIETNPDIVKAIIRINEEPFSVIGQYIGFPNKILFDEDFRG